MHAWCITGCINNISRKNLPGCEHVSNINQCDKKVIFLSLCRRTNLVCVEMIMLMLLNLIIILSFRVNSFNYTGYVC